CAQMIAEHLAASGSFTIVDASSYFPMWMRCRGSRTGIRSVPAQSWSGVLLNLRMALKSPSIYGTFPRASSWPSSDTRPAPKISATPLRASPRWCASSWSAPEENSGVRARQRRGEMQAAYIERFGGPEVINYGELPDPV